MQAAHHTLQSNTFKDAFFPLCHLPPCHAPADFDSVKDIGMNAKGSTLFLTHSPAVIRWASGWLH